MGLKQTVEVMGIPIAIESGHKDPAYAMTVAKYVEHVGKPIEKSLPGVTREKLAVMVALELADQLVRVVAGERKAITSVERAIEEIEKASAGR